MIFLYSWRIQVRMFILFLDIVIQRLLRNCSNICSISSIYVPSFNNVNICRESSTTSYGTPINKLLDVLQNWHIQTKYSFNNLNVFFIKDVMIIWCFASLFKFILVTLSVSIREHLEFSVSWEANLLPINSRRNVSKHGRKVARVIDMIESKCIR